MRRAESRCRTVRNRTNKRIAIADFPEPTAADSRPCESRLEDSTGPPGQLDAMAEGVLPKKPEDKLAKTAGNYQFYAREDTTVTE